MFLRLLLSFSFGKALCIHIWDSCKLSEKELYILHKNRCKKCVQVTKMQEMLYKKWYR